jgi:hypothetical protein
MRGVTAITDVQTRRITWPSTHRRVASRLCDHRRSYEGGALACMSYPAKHTFDFRQGVVSEVWFDIHLDLSLVMISCLQAQHSCRIIDWRVIYSSLSIYTITKAKVSTFFPSPVCWSCNSTKQSSSRPGPTPPTPSLKFNSNICKASPILVTLPFQGRAQW